MDNIQPDSDYKTTCSISAAQLRADKKIDSDFKKDFCKEYRIKHFSHAVKSFSRLRTQKAMRKHFADNELPDCDYVFRVTLRCTAKTYGGETELYDPSYKLLKIIPLT